MTTFILRAEDGKFFAGYKDNPAKWNDAYRREEEFEGPHIIPCFINIIPSRTGASGGKQKVSAIDREDLNEVIADLEKYGIKNLSPVLIG